jgi:hypothetical protein
VLVKLGHQGTGPTETGKKARRVGDDHVGLKLDTTSGDVVPIMITPAAQLCLEWAEHPFAVQTEKWRWAALGVWTLAVGDQSLLNGVVLSQGLATPC